MGRGHRVRFNAITLQTACFLQDALSQHKQFIHNSSLTLTHLRIAELRGPGPKAPACLCLSPEGLSGCLSQSLSTWGWGVPTFQVIRRVFHSDGLDIILATEHLLWVIFSTTTPLLFLVCCCFGLAKDVAIGRKLLSFSWWIYPGLSSLSTIGPVL